MGVLQTCLSLVLIAGALVIRPQAAIGLLVVAALFVPLERVFWLHKRRVFRAGWRTDVVHFLVNSLLSLVLLFAGAVVIGLPLRALTPSSLRSAIASLPAAAQFAIALVVVELSFYWAHRLAHRSPRLWRFHKVHHSIAHMDWLAAARLHPVDQGFERLAVVVPLLMLGFSQATFGAYLGFSTVQALLVHANVRFRLGPFRWVLATPQFHHWHHGNTPESYNTNFAAQMPIIDYVFGTVHLPRHSWPAQYGVCEPLPRGYVAQLAWPFRRTSCPPPVYGP